MDEFVDFVYGDNGLGNIDIDESNLFSVVFLVVFDYIIEKLKESLGEIMLVVVGCMINLVLVLCKCLEIKSLVK